METSGDEPKSYSFWFCLHMVGASWSWWLIVFRNLRPTEVRVSQLMLGQSDKFLALFNLMLLLCIPILYVWMVFR